MRVKSETPTGMCSTAGAFTNNAGPTHLLEVVGHRLRTARRVRFTGECADAQIAGALRAIAAEIATAAPDPFLLLRNVRLTEDQAAELAKVLAALVDGIEDAGDDQPRYGLLVGLYRPMDRGLRSDRK